MANSKSEELTQELVDFGVRVIKFVESTKLPRSVADQLIRSATSIGANFAEAQDAASKKDFLNKIYIAKKEANETKYWLKIVDQLTEVDASIVDSAQKFLMILQKIISSSKARQG